MLSRFIGLLAIALFWSQPVHGLQQGGPVVPIPILETYAATYRLAPNTKLTVALAGDRLTASLTGSEALAMTALSNTTFRIAEVSIEFEFFKNEKGDVTHVVLRQNGQEQSAVRVPEKIAVKLPSEILKRYVGTYMRRPGFDVLITLEGDRLMAESTGQFKSPLFPESETRFFFKDVDAEIEFAANAKGEVGRLVLHRGSVHETAFLAAEGLPGQLNDKEFWKIVTDFSEPNGTYRFENFVSNEDDYQVVLPELKKTFNPGSIFIGVGPEQNLTYISALKPKMAFVVDIRRQNLLELLLYKAVFELSADRVEFLSRLFSRRAPSGLTTSSTAKALFEAFEQVPSDQQLFDSNLSAAWDLLTKKHGFALSAEDKQGLTKVYTAFFQGGPAMTYQTMDIRFTRSRVGPAPATWSYKALMSTTTDRLGHNWSYMATEESFSTVQDYEKKNLIIPIVGDFAGPKALRAIGQYAKEHGATIGLFYASNVDEYLFDNEVQDKFLSNVATFPLNPSSMMIRVNGGPSAGVIDGTYQVAEGKKWAALLCSMPDLVGAFNAGEIQTRTDVNWLSRRSVD